MTSSTFELEEFEAGITRIELPPLGGHGAALSGPVNVYLIDGPSPALINAGHPSQADLLLESLRECQIEPSSIERIVATSWAIDVVGGATRFPRADLFVMSPDMAAPRDYDTHLENRRRALGRLAAELADQDPEFRRQPVDDDIAAFFPRSTRSLSFAPLRNGHFLRAGELDLEVLATAGPGPGHMALFCADHQLLFCGDFAMSGLPDRLTDPQSYLVSLQRLAELPSELVLPNRSRPYQQGRWTVTRAANFLNSFLSNAPAALFNAPTVLEFLERDRGLGPDRPTELVVNVELFQKLFDELVRSNAIAAAGRGITRRYGVDVDDPRAKLR